MHGSRLLLLVVLYALIARAPATAQERRGVMGAGLSIGATNYIGDLDDNFTLIFTRPGVGAHATFLFFPRLHMRLSYFHGRLTASDDKGSFAGNKYRNLSFYSSVDEASLQFLYTLQNRKRGFSKRNRLAPYVFAGIAYFHFDPKRDLDGTTYHLQEVGTEGQHLPGDYPDPYSLWQWSVPMGFGFQLKLTENLDIGIETGFRKTFTDYLDDVSTKYPDKQLLLAMQGPVAVELSDPSNDPDYPNGKPSFSQRGSAGQDDWYVYTNVNITYYFTTNLFKAYKPKNKFRDNTCKGLMKAK